MATRAEFIVQFPEFAAANVAQVNAFLAAADLEIDREVWGAKADQGQMYLAAHKLALSPFGNAAQMTEGPAGPGPHGETTFGTHYDSMMAVVGSAWRVIL